VSSQPKVVLSIAGYDPSSGAGVTADIKTAAAHGCFAITCPTALTIQSTQGVKAVEPLSASTVERTLSTLAEDFKISAVRIGMLGSAAVALAVVEFLRQAAIPILVVDPVLRSSSGAALLEEAGLAIVRDQLLPLCTVVTPNIAEAEALTGIPIRSNAEQSEAAGLLLHLGAGAAVVTGGHLTEARDLLAWKDEAGSHEEVFSGSILNSSNTHGTGCAFATAIACSLANEISLVDSVRAAKAFVRSAIASAPGLGHGRGPLNLLWGLDQD
jgi:hydroxymethylpyrimidine kinase/phosphomethylpyrimidine kinase